MTTNAGDSNEIRRYLLGGLTEEEGQGVEQRLLTDEDFFEELLFVEEELTDQYLKEGLDEDERRAFEGHFLSTPERRRKLRFAKALNRYVSEHSATASGVEAAASQPQHVADLPILAGRARPSFWSGWGWTLRASTAFAVVALMVVGAWFATRPTTPRTFATISLSPTSATRGGGGDDTQTTSVRLSPDTDALRILLTLPGGSSPAQATRFSVLLEDVRGVGERFEAERVDGQTVSVVIPATRLARDRYTLKLFASAAEGAEQKLPGSYFFNVE